MWWRGSYCCSRCSGSHRSPSGYDRASGTGSYNCASGDNTVPARGPATNRYLDLVPPDGYSHRRWRSPGSYQHPCTHADPGSGAGRTAQGRPGNRGDASAAGN